MEGPAICPREVHLPSLERISQPPNQSMCCPAASPGRACWRWFCSRSLTSTSRSIANLSAMDGRVLISACRPWPTRSAAVSPSYGRSITSSEPIVFAGDRLRGDDTTILVLARGQTITGRAWVYVRDDRPFGGRGPPAAVFHYSRDRTANHPARHRDGYAALQADAYAGFSATRTSAARERAGHWSRRMANWRALNGPDLDVHWVAWACRTPTWAGSP